MITDEFEHLFMYLLTLWGSSSMKYGQESLRRNGLDIIVNKRVQTTVLGCNLISNRMISVHFQGKPFNITVFQIYVPTTSAEEVEVEEFYEDLHDLLELTRKKKKERERERCSFHHRGLECSSRNSSRDTWSNRQVSPWSTK